MSKAESTARRILVTGLVQGVGFRPFVARLASELGIKGRVINSGEGVEVEACGYAARLDEFEARIARDAPPMAEVLAVVSSPIEACGSFDGFRIEASRVDPFASVVVPPDIATCTDCDREIADAADRRYRYPFTNCTNCGPRYTIIESVPYDRARTTMKGFAMCPACEAEYSDPANRRFHAQPNACPVCGPRLKACDGGGAEVAGDPFALAVTVLRSGGIVALMGVGGLHLACDASSEEAVAKLRKRKNRPAKPLAVMAADIAHARKIATLDEGAERLLLSPEAPIVLCEAAVPSPLAPSVAPGQAQVGVFLPSTPLHKLLFASGAPELLVMTSGNRSDEPIISDNARALAELRSVADLFLLHDRPILHPVDDSVVRMVEGVGPVMVRRARGYAPKPLPVPSPGEPILAVGAELLNTITILKGGLAFVGPHCGDLKNPETEEAFRRTVGYLKDILKVEPELVVCDLHPAYLSSRYAAELEAGGASVARVQHHEAHAASCMAEHGHFDREGLALVLDGLGLGRDGTFWGGELFRGTIADYRRIGHIATIRQPGGDAASREPWRMAAAYLKRIKGASWTSLPLPAFASRTQEELATIDAMIDRGLNSPLASSCGRLFDATAAILGFSGRMGYTAQAPMELEALAARAAQARKYLRGEVIWKDGTLEIDPARTLETMTADALAGIDRGEAALGFHIALADTFVEALAQASEATGIMDIFISGGCFQNGLLTALVSREASELGLRVHHHRKLPPNDGGVSFGQACIAASTCGGAR